MNDQFMKIKRAKTAFANSFKRVNKRSDTKERIVINGARNWEKKVAMKRDENAEYGIQGLPEDWIRRLREAGVTEEEFKKNKKNAIDAVKFIADGETAKMMPLLTQQEMQKRMAKAAPINNKNHKRYCEKLEMVGEGASGQVFKIRRRKDARVLAAKISKREELKYIEKEIAIHALSIHKNIVSYHETFLDGDDVWIIMDYVDGPALTHLLDERCPEWTEPHIAFVMKECLVGLDFMHKQHLLHRDIKSDNILVGKDGTVKLADFGFAAPLDRDNVRRKSTAGTPYWMAPEVIQQVPYDARCDIWSLAITAIELVDHEPPHMQEETVKACLNILTLPSPRPQNPDLYSEEFLHFLERGLKKKYEKRATAEELLGHKFLDQVASLAEFCDFLNYVLARMPDDVE